MPYDKVVDSAVLDAGLKQVADAIREKGGTSDSLTFPSAMAEAIAAIQAGGGGGEGVPIATGSFLPTLANPNYTVTHGLGVVPNFAICYRSMEQTATSRYNSYIYLAKLNEVGTMAAYKGSNFQQNNAGQDTTHAITDIPTEYAPYVGAYGATENEITFGFNYDSARGDTYFCYDASWDTYYWIVGVI